MIQRYILLVLVACFLLLSPAWSFGRTENEYNEEKMTTLAGEEVLLANRNDVFTNSEFGFGFVVPESMMNLVQQGVLEIIPVSATTAVITLYASEFFELMTTFDANTSTEEEMNAFRDKIQNYAFDAAVLLRLPPESERTNEGELLEYIRETYAVVDEIELINDTTYYFAYNTDFSDILFTDTEKTQAEILINELTDFDKNIFVFRPEAGASGLTDFEVETLDGETVTEAIFKDYGVTMVNVWATWCGPCIDEMPDLARLHSTMLPDDANMITILTDSDAPGGIEAAHEIIDSVSGEFMTLIPNEDLQPLLSAITAIPTTIFVDSEGNILGDPIVGAPGSNPADIYLSAIGQLLLSQ